MIKINLLPVKEIEEKQKVLVQLIIGLVLIIVACMAMGAAYVIKQSQIDTVKRNIKEKEDILKKPEYSNLDKNIKEQEDTEKQLEKKRKRIEELKEGREFFIKVIDKIAESVPPNQLWLTSLEYNGEMGGRIELEGAAYDKDAVAVFMENLAVIPCDDEKIDKHPVCVARNEACLTTEGTEDSSSEASSKVDFFSSSCKQFYENKKKEYKKELQKMKSYCKKSACCKPDGNEAECTEMQKTTSEEGKKKPEPCTKEECQRKIRQYDKIKAYRKLHEQEFIDADTIVPNFIRSGRKSKAGASQTYMFRLEMKAAKK